MKEADFWEAVEPYLEQDGIITIGDLQIALGLPEKEADKVAARFCKERKLCRLVTRNSWGYRKIDPEDDYPRESRCGVISKKRKPYRKPYPTGNPVFLEMINSGGFDGQKAKEIMAGTDLNQPINIPFGVSSCSTTYLYEAVEANNLPAVAFLLDNGANPNFNNPDLDEDCALWQLQYIDEDQDWQTRYEIGKLFFQHGADPNLVCDGETFYDYVRFKVYNDDTYDENDWQNLLHLYKLLVLYGGGGKTLGYKRPEFKKAIDLSKIDEYDVRLYACDDGYHIAGMMVDGEGNEISFL